MVIKNIQALRALAANAIILLHLLALEQRYGNGTVLFSGNASFLASGVDLFFVISGFIMALIVAEGERWPSFLIARITRIYPIYWIYSSILVLSFFVAPEALNRGQMPALWHSYLLIPGKDFPILSAGWTLIHEMYFYLVVTVILFFRLPLRYALAGWAAAICVASFFIAPDNISPALALMINPLTFEFILGACIGLLVRRGYRRYARLALAYAMAALVLAWHTVTDFNAVPLWQHPLLLGIPFALLIYAAAGLREIPSRLLEKIGNASYSIYLSHILVLSTLGRIFVKLTTHGPFAEAAYLIVSFLAANLFGLLSYRFLEKPLIRFFRAKSRHVGGYDPSRSEVSALPNR